MRCLWVLISLALVACSSSPTSHSEDTTKTAAALIASNDPKACADQDAINTALSAAEPDYGPYLKAGGTPIKVDTVSATEIKSDIHEITCSAVAHYHTQIEQDEASRPFVYKLRPTVDKAGFVAEIPDVHEIAGPIIGHIAWAKGQQAGPSPAPPNAPVQVASDSPDAASTSEQGGECHGRVLQEVHAIEDATATMHAGQTWPDITQYWKNDKTGESHFCAHGDYCYPAQVTVAGKKVEAIKLENCSIGNKVDQDGDDAMYSVG